MNIRLNHSFFIKLSIIFICSCNTVLPKQALAETPVTQKAQKVDPKMDRFLTDLISKLSLEEKLGQLTLVSTSMTVTGPVENDSNDAQIKKMIQEGKVGNVFNVFTPKATREFQEVAMNPSGDKAYEKNRNRIPLMFGFDVIHGHKTVFPLPLAESSTWDLELIEKSSRISTIEAAANGVHWTFAPMVDIARDPRWGRIAEGAGEDTWLASQIAVARVKGIQGKSLSDADANIACVKHFAAYGAAEGGEDYNRVRLDDLELFERYLPTYEAAVKAGVGSLMTGFNSLNGIPVSANPKLLQDVLKKSWGFKGFTVSDYTSINELVKHRFVANEKEAALAAFKAGVDMDMQGYLYLKYLPELLNEGKVKIAEIDAAVRRVLEAKYRLGLFANPYRNSDQAVADAVIMSSEHMRHARDVAAKSVVLLKNTNGALPLQAQNIKIALIGPLADNKVDQIGSWSMPAESDPVITLKNGIENFISRPEITEKPVLMYAKGANLLNDSKLRRFLNNNGGNIQDDPKPAEQLLKEAVATAMLADTTILALGESQGMSGEGASRASLQIPTDIEARMRLNADAYVFDQKTLLRAIASRYARFNARNPERKKKLVVVVFSGRPLVLTEEDKLADAVVEAWFLGTQAGNALADVLFGAHNPSGKLPVSFPYSDGQNPSAYDSESTGRPYNPENPLFKYQSMLIDSPKNALYPFGWGLSYTSFEYSDIKLSASDMSVGGSIKVSVTIKNTGPVSGIETAQLYIEDLVSSHTRAQKNLRAFKKVNLAPGESATVEFSITDEDLKFYVEDLESTNAYRVKKIAEAGEFKVMVGGNSRDLKSQAIFTLK